jgi:hypothetical protein
MPGERYVPCAEVSIHQEPNGYWSARVTVDLEHHQEWRAAATAFHDVGEALAWARQEVLAAVDA